MKGLVSMAGVLNGDGSQPSSLFGVRLPDSTGASGSTGVTAGETAGGVVGTPVVSVPFATSQLPAMRPTIEVLSGDTSAFSSDNPINGGPLQPGPLSGPGSYIDTGAGSGSGHSPHPNAGQ
jgi:hypothetical protein